MCITPIVLLKSEFQASIFFFLICVDQIIIMVFFYKTLRNKFETTKNKIK